MSVMSKSNNKDMEIEKVFDYNEKWIAELLEKDPDYFNNLSKGQSPQHLFIGCSDSRISVDSLLQADIGEVFVHRNIANLAPNNDFNFISALNYAVSHLKVKHIIVCGHYYCGGIKAALGHDDLGFLNPWLRNIMDIYRIHQEELDGIQDEQVRYNRLVELNVIEQCFNLCKTVDVQKAYKSREIYIHGWVFDIKTGKLINMNIDIHKMMREMNDIYRYD